ncbi:MAG: hypothetical protein ABIO72_02850 [Patescibacteria group bacterium]
MLRKALLSFAAIVAALSMALPTNAATSLNWTDLSSQLTTRTNRPVWAMAYANGNWFYTDGQELWNGGQVYRYDGTTQTNITTDVRNAGISRVDDIVTDGMNVIFFKNIFRLDNSIEAVRYNSGSYSNVSTQIRSALDSNEGISSIVGRNGTWMMVSTRARLVRFSENFSSYTRITAPSEMKQFSSSDQSLLHSAHNRMDQSYSAGIVLAPAGNSFLLGVSSVGLVQYTGVVQYYRYDGQSFVKTMSPPETNFDVSGIAFNQNSAFVIANVAGNRFGKIFVYDGSSWQTQGNWYGTTGGSWNQFDYTSNFTMTWDGTQWLIVSGKNLYSLMNGTLELIGPMRDYFVTGASNGNGTTLLGGAVSTLGTNQPTSPLTAKLSKVTESYISTPTPNNTQTSGNISSWTWLDPNQTSIMSNGVATFNVGAWAGNGLSRVDIVVNGTTRRTCNFSTAFGNQACSYTLYGGDYGVGTNVSMNAQVTDVNGKTMWTPLTNVYVTNVNGTTYNPTPSNSNSNGSVWAWSTPETSTIATNASAQFSVGASDPDGISKIEMYVNGSIWNTCNLGTAYGSQSCYVTINGSSFTAGSDVFVNAKVTDIYGNTTWTGSRSYRIIAASTPVPSSSVPTANWIWSTPDTGVLSMNQSATFNIGAWDTNGLNRTEIWVNGQLKKTCSFGNVVGNRDCSFTINANEYPVGTSAFVNAMMVDGLGNTTWSASRSYAITSSTYNTQNQTFPGNLPGSVSVTSNRDTGYANNQYITYTASAADQNGLDRVELYVNGTLVKTCYNVSSCSWTGGYYNTRNYVNYGATIVDKAGFALWTGYKTIAKK